jgi:hypothetical protein
MRILLASIAAILVQPLTYVLFFTPYYLAAYPAEPLPSDVGFFLLWVIAVASAAVIVLGIPAFILLRKFNREGWTSLAIAGFVLSAVPVAFSWPRRIDGHSSSNNWHGYFVETYVNGMPTTYAWLEYFEGVIYFGLHGLIGALVFYAVWRRLDKRKKPIEI